MACTIYLGVWETAETSIKASFHCWEQSFCLETQQRSARPAVVGTVQQLCGPTGSFPRSWLQWSPVVFRGFHLGLLSVVYFAFVGCRPAYASNIHPSMHCYIASFPPQGNQWCVVNGPFAAYNFAVSHVNLFVWLYVVA